MVAEVRALAFAVAVVPAVVVVVVTAAPGRAEPTLPGDRLAQAEPSPPGYRVAQAEPAPPGYRVAQAEPALPGYRVAQAEPAPPGYVPPGHAPEPPPPSPLKWHIAVDARLAVPLGARPPSLPPVGWGAGVQLTRALVDVGRMRIGVGADFAYQRVQHDKDTKIPFGATQQWLSHMTFAGLAVLDGIFDRLRPWLVLGGGLSVAQYTDPATDMSQTTVAVQSVVPLLQLALGLDVELARGVDLGLGGQFDLTFSSQAVGTPASPTAAPQVQPFSPGLFSTRLELGFRF
jgi:hypothetical protein